MIRIPGLNKLSPAHTVFELQTQAHIGGPPGAFPDKFRPLKIDGPFAAPKFIRMADMRPSTMKVKGKSNYNAITMSKDPGVPCTDSMMPHFGNFRGHPKGMLFGANPHIDIDGEIMPRPESDGYLPTKLKEP